MIHCGDCLTVLKTLPAASVQCVVTSPPYWGLRDYGHAGQIGMEATPEAFTAALVTVFAEVSRVLRDDGVCWLNLGDSYATTGGVSVPQSGALFSDRRRGQEVVCRSKRMGRGAGRWGGGNNPAAGLLKAKDLIGIPWRVAFALQAAGWYLRSDIIWSKPNPMPESVQDRPTKAHEYIFLLTKSPKYYYDADAIREVGAGREDVGDMNIEARLNSGGPWKPYTGKARKDYAAAGAQDPSEVKARITDKLISGELIGRNRRSVWTVATQPFPGAHFATFPEALIEPCILAGSRQGDVVLDPFCGSGTVGVVCAKAQRQFIGIELNQAYVAMANARIAAVAPLFHEQAI